MKNELSILQDTLKEAGAAILDLQHKGFKSSRKAGYQLVTEADMLADHIIKTNLLRAYPDDGWLSEETADTFDRLKRKRVWIVDPIDGTKEFAANIPEYAVSVALVENGYPILAGVYNPATDELFYASKGQGAWLNNQKIYCQEASPSEIIILASRTEYQRGKWQAMSEQFNVKPIGSIAYKLALVASGMAQATFSLGEKSEWDIAAGILLVQEAGGITCDRNFKPHIFNQKNILVEGVIATTSLASPIILDGIRRYF